MTGGEHLEGDGALEGELPRPGDDAHAAAAEDCLHLVAGHLRQGGGGKRRHQGVGTRTGPHPWKQGPDLRVDMAERLPPLPDLGEHFGAVAAHLLRRLPRVEHLLEQAEHLGVAGHRRSSSSEG
jgi:hypothetical protein